MARSKKQKFEELHSFPFVFEHTDEGFEEGVEKLFKDIGRSASASGPTAKYKDGKHGHASTPLSMTPNSFYNSNVTLELGCGRGEYTVGLATLNPGLPASSADGQPRVGDETLPVTSPVFIGIDIQGERIWYGAKQVEELDLKNVFFLRDKIENIENYIPENSISDIWITFPDPFPRDRDEKRRLTSRRFLEIYRRILRIPEPEGEQSIVRLPIASIHLKTDNQDLFEYTKESVKEFGGEIVEEIEDIDEFLNTDASVGAISNRPYKQYLQIQTKFEKKWASEGKKIYYLRFKLQTV